MKRINPLGFLGFVGFIGVIGFFTDSSSSFAYFAYLAYFYYFSQPFTEDLRLMTFQALGLAYLVSFVVNLAFISSSYFSGSPNYESGFYLAYSAGSFSFPITFGILKARFAILTRRRDR